MDCKQFEEDQVQIRIGSQTDTDFLQRTIEEFGAPDVVLDDGSHQMRDVVETFRFLYPRTATDGVYVVEDLHTAYWDEFGGGLKCEGSFIEVCKGLIDELNADWSRGQLLPTEFTRSNSRCTSTTVWLCSSVVATYSKAHRRSVDSDHSKFINMQTFQAAYLHVGFWKNVRIHSAFMSFVIRMRHI